MNAFRLEGGVTKVFRLKSAKAIDVRAARGAFEVEMAHDNDLQIPSVRGSDEAVAAISETIKEIDEAGGGDPERGAYIPRPDGGTGR